MSERVFYSTAEDVIQSTGIRAADLNFKNENDLKEWIEKRLVEIKDLIDRDRNRDYHEEGDVPPGIDAIALRIMSNHVGHAVLRRTTPIIRVDDFTIKMVEDSVFTKAIKDDLKRYPAKLNGIVGRLGIMVIKK